MLLSPNYVTLQVDSFASHDGVQVVCAALPGALNRDVLLDIVQEPLFIAEEGSLFWPAQKRGELLQKST